MNPPPPPPESSPELSVVCRSCGSEVSPYVTECPYCGSRIRKRAPKLERHGDEITVREPRRRRRRRARGPRAVSRPYATVAAIAAPAILLIVLRATGVAAVEVGAIVGPVGSEWWRLLAAPFVYTDIGYLFVIGITIGIFGPGLERRLGTVPTVMLLVATGALGMLAADGAASIGLDDSLSAAGGNGVALGALGAWVILLHGERRAHPEVDPYDVIGVAVLAVVLLALPLVESSASPIAGVGGGAVGVVCAWLATRFGRVAPG